MKRVYVVSVRDPQDGGAPPTAVWAASLPLAVEMIDEYLEITMGGPYDIWEGALVTVSTHDELPQEILEDDEVQILDRDEEDNVVLVLRDGTMVRPS